MKIIRRLSKSVKLPIGRHMIVTRETKKGVFARNVGEHAEFWLAENLDNFVEVSSTTCRLSKIEFEAMKYAIQIHHPLDINNKEWTNILDKRPDVIKFWYPEQGCIYIWPDLIKKRIINKELYVYIEIKMRAYEKPISKKR